jgi:competence protein ComEA
MPNPSRPSRWLLRRTDQMAVASLVVVALAAMGGWWASHGGFGPGMIEIDRADPLVARFEVDVNTADWPELIQLPGIGPTLARRIVDTRQTSGLFREPDDLRRVRGIGPKTLERMRPYLRPMPGRGVAGK